MIATPLVPGPVYGLRTWTVTGAPGAERLAAPHRGVTWPAGGAWFEATCSAGHTAPDSACSCGAHAWHPRLRSARRSLASRREVAGIVEACGPVELHEDGFRAQRSRLYALVQAPRSNVALLLRLSAAYGVPVVAVSGPREMLAWCQERGLGLDEAVVAELLGVPPTERRRGGIWRLRTVALRLAVLAAVVTVLLALGIARDPKGDRVLFGRTGPVHVHH
jgi:hypothetical protein